MIRRTLWSHTIQRSLAGFARIASEYYSRNERGRHFRRKAACFLSNTSGNLTLKLLPEASEGCLTSIVCLMMSGSFVL